MGTIIRKEAISMQLFVRDKNFYKTLAGLTIPIVAQQLITAGVNMVDNIMLGQLGEISMSGATLANNFISLFQIMCMGMGMGASVLTSRYFGMKDKESLKKVMVLTQRLNFSVAAIFAMATLLFPGALMRLYTNEEAVVSAGIGYLLISVPCYFLHGASLTTSLVLRSVGKANIPLYASIVSFFINIFFNWVFIFGHFGAPAMGVKGAALGTLIARVVEFIVTMGYLFFRDQVIGFRMKDLKMSCSGLTAEYIRISIPVLVSDSLQGLGNNVIAIVTGHIGAAYVAANAITIVVMVMSTVITQGISHASCTITGITLGQGDSEKAQRQGVTFAALGAILGAVGCLIILLIKGPVIGFYNIAPETKALADELMNAVGVVVIFQCVNSILTKGVLRGGGDTKFLMIADILFLWCASIPLGILAGLVLHWPGFWIYIMLKIDQFIKAIWCVFRLKSGKWIKKIDRAKG